MEIEEPVISSHIALAHGRSAKFLLSSVQTSKCYRAEVGTVEKTTPTTTTRATTVDKPTAMGKALARPDMPRNVLHTFNSFSSGVNASHESFDCTLEYHVPTYPAIPPLHTGNATNSSHRACGLSASRGKRLPQSSARQLTAVIEHKPPVHAPARLTAKPSVETLPLFDIDDVAEKKEAITGFLNVPTQDRGSRTSTMSSVVSAKSHQGPGAIYIRPSAQLQNMQSISDRDRRLQEAARFYSSALSLANSRGVRTPTGTPESISNIPLSTSVYQAHAKLNRTLSSRSDFASQRSVRNWAKSSEWVEPCQTTEGATEWIEDFLTRKEQADRAEQEQTRTEKKEKITVMRGNSIDKFRRRLSRRRTTGEKRNVERRGKSDNVDLPEWARAFSWDVRTHGDVLGQDGGPSNQTSNRVSPDRTPSPPPRAPPSSEAAKPSRRSPPTLSRFPSSANPFGPSTPANPPRSHRRKHDSPQLSPRTLKHPVHHQSRSSSKTGGRGSSSSSSTLPKLKSRSVSLIGVTDMKKSFSTTVVPILAEGKNSVSEFVGKLERLGQGMTWGVIGRKLTWRVQRGKKREKWRRVVERKTIDDDGESDI